MGVMRCSRKNCDEIMCHTYVDSIGYICHECQEEFKEYLKQEQVFEKLSKGEIRSYLKIFMNSTKGDFDDEEMDVDEFFDKFG